MSEDQNYRTRLHECYSEERTELLKTSLEVSNRYDHWLLTLAGGALGISLLFLKEIAPHPLGNTVFLLGLAWACLVLALLSGFASLLTGYHSVLRQIWITDERYRRQDAAVVAEMEPHEITPLPPNKFSKITTLLNWTSAVMFTMGTVFLCCFAYVNLSVTSANSNTKTMTGSTNTIPSIK